MTALHRFTAAIYRLGILVHARLCELPARRAPLRTAGLTTTEYVLLTGAAAGIALAISAILKAKITSAAHHIDIGGSP